MEISISHIRIIGKFSAIRFFKFEVLDYLFPYLKKRMAENLPMILCGDINIAHKEIDLKNYKGNKKKFRFSARRASMDDRFI